MKTSSSIVIAILIVVALAVSTAVTLFLAAAPYLLLLAVVFAIGRATRHRTGTPTTARHQPGPIAQPPSTAVGPSGWVLVPVWLGPNPHRRPLPVLDAEVIDDGRRPR